MSNYTSIGNFGNSNQNSLSDPMALIASSGLGAGFQNVLGASYLNPDGEHAQKYAAQWCATVGWNGTCEVLSKNVNRALPNTMASCYTPNGSCQINLTQGQQLVRNTAMEKYLVAMSDNCVRQYQPFDPTSADSPLMSSWVNQGYSSSNKSCKSCSWTACVPIYGVDPSKIDQDPVMNKILAEPWIAMDILINIYNNLKRKGKLSTLKNTKLGTLFETQYFQQQVQKH